jgi:glucan phosphoethanolaminetransferase (alkaline phosphatase superfamily)
MSVKLFRSTGFPEVFEAGKIRPATHPAWLILGISLWVGFVCNVALWRAADEPASSAALQQTLVLALAISAASATLVSLFGSRGTFKPVASMLLLAAGLGAACEWSLPPGGVAELHATVMLWLDGSPLPWKAIGVLAACGVAPVLLLWRTPVRRMASYRQRNINYTGAFFGAVLLCISSLVLASGRLAG